MFAEERALNEGAPGKSNVGRETEEEEYGGKVAWAMWCLRMLSTSRLVRRVVKIIPSAYVEMLVGVLELC